MSREDRIRELVAKKEHAETLADELRLLRNDIANDEAGLVRHLVEEGSFTLLKIDWQRVKRAYMQSE